MSSTLHFRELSRKKLIRLEFENSELERYIRYDLERRDKVYTPRGWWVSRRALPQLIAKAGSLSMNIDVGCPVGLEEEDIHRLLQKTVPKNNSPYNTLYVNEDAPPEVVKAAFKVLAAKHHPDSSEEPDADKFIEIKKAYDDIRKDNVTVSRS